MTGLLPHAETLLGEALTHARPLHGGDLSPVMAAERADGTIVVVKGGPDPLVEAAMLRALGDAQVPVPAVLAADEDVLILSHCRNTGDLAQCWADLGSTLRRLHESSAETYGWPQPYAFGHVMIAGESDGPWPDFWARYRLLCHGNSLPASLQNRLERLCASLGDHLPAQPRASLLHGDCWSGNILCDDGKISALIDPACSTGHSEVDLAMLTLFSNPSPAFWATYGPLEPSHEARRAIYQLWPALVHVRLFGSGYHGLVDRLLKAVGA